MNSFEELQLSPELNQAITELGYTQPSPIQQQALPILLGEATDFIGLAATGTGKTAAFGIPLLEKIDVSKKHVQALIMCPTRELALQVTGQINLLGKFKGVRALSIYGGSDYGNQTHGLRQGAMIVVGTPGRLVDHLERGTLDLKNVKTVVLDEADEMISMGFKEDLEAILDGTERDESNIWLFSATMDRGVSKVADEYLRNAKQVQVNRKDVLSTTVEQIYFRSRESDKPEILCKIIEAADDFYGIVFCQTKALVVDLTRYLTNRGYKVDCLHGDKDQKSREHTMQAFRDRSVNLLVCTDVASRGLDVKDVTHVINYSIPRELESYVHRIGRTARGGKSGIAISLVTPSHRNLIPRIEQMTKSQMVEGRLPTRKDIGIKKIAKFLSQFQEVPSYERAMELISEEWKTVLAKMSPEEIVGRFLAMTSPEIFEDREKERPMASPQASVRAERSGEEGRGGRRGGGYRRGGDRDDRRGGGRREYRGGGGRYSRGGDREDFRAGDREERKANYVPREERNERKDYSAPREERSEHSAPREERNVRPANYPPRERAPRKRDERPRQDNSIFADAPEKRSSPSKTFSTGRPAARKEFAGGNSRDQWQKKRSEKANKGTNRTARAEW